MSHPIQETTTLLGLIASGGWVMYPLGFFSVMIWGIIIERLFYYRKLSRQWSNFHLEAMNLILRHEVQLIEGLCLRYSRLSSVQLILLALERLGSQDERLREGWFKAVERKRQSLNLELKQNLWILGTLASAAPFVGLFGTVLGILKSFRQMVQAGSGGFSIVAAGISESLVATAAGIVVAVVAILAFNIFQTQAGQWILKIRSDLEEFLEVLVSTLPEENTQKATVVKGTTHG